MESLVIVDQHCHGEYVLWPCTHRPSRFGSGFFVNLLRKKNGSIYLSGKIILCFAEVYMHFFEERKLRIRNRI